MVVGSTVGSAIGISMIEVSALAYLSVQGSDTGIRMATILMGTIPMDTVRMDTIAIGTITTDGKGNCLTICMDGDDIYEQGDQDEQ
jgi:hypothetical protein